MSSIFFDDIKKMFNEIREKVQVKEGSIILEIETNKWGIAISDLEYITLSDSNINNKAIVEKFSPIDNYLISCVDEEVFENQDIMMKAIESLSIDNYLSSKFKSTFEYICNILDIEASNIENFKKKLNNIYGINKWKNFLNSNYLTDLNVKKSELELEIANNFQILNKNSTKEMLITKYNLGNKLEIDEDRLDEIIKKVNKNEILENKLNRNIKKIEKPIQSIEKTIKNIKDFLKNLENKISEKNLNDTLDKKDTCNINFLNIRKEEIIKNMEDFLENLEDKIEEKDLNIEEESYDEDNLNIKKIVSNKEKNLEKNGFCDTASLGSIKKVTTKNIKNFDYTLLEKSTFNGNLKQKNIKDTIEKTIKNMKYFLENLEDQINEKNLNIEENRVYLNINNGGVIKNLKDFLESLENKINEENLNDSYSKLKELELQIEEEVSNCNGGNKISKEEIEEKCNEKLEQVKNLDPRNIRKLREEKRDLYKYLEEIKDEDIEGKKNLEKLNKELDEILFGLKETNGNLSGGYGLVLGDLKNISSDFFKFLKIFEKYPSLKELIEKVGRGIDTEKKEEMVEEIIISEFDKEEVFGLELSDNISKCLVSELIYLSEKATEDIFYYKFATKNLLCYKLIGKEKKYYYENRKGAIVALLDTSGSMDGVPINKGKAILLNILKIAINDKRDYKIILFGSIGEIVVYEVDIENPDFNDFTNFINKAFDGGTDFETPLSKAIDIIKEENKYTFADILMLTDGQATISKKLSKKIEEAKKELDLKIYTGILTKEKLEKSCEISNENLYGLDIISCSDESLSL